MLQLPVFFSITAFFGQPKVSKRLYGNYNNPITHLFTRMNQNFGGAAWIGRFVKVVGIGGEGGETPGFLFCL